MSALIKHAVDNKPARALAFFKDLTLFADLDDAQVIPFVTASHTTTYKKGDLLYHEGDAASMFYIVCHGWVKLFRESEEGEEVSLAMLTTNSICGTNAMFEEGSYACSTRIVEDAKIISVPLSLLKERLGLDTRLAFNMIRSMVQHQRLQEMMLERFLLYSAPQRIGCFLLALCPVPKQKDGATLELPYDKKLIASALSMKGATFSRALNILRDETGLQITGAHIKIDSIERLLTFVNGCYSHHKIES